MSRLRTWTQVGGLALLWGSTFLWIDRALEAMTPVQVTLSRCALGSAALLVACFASGRRLPPWGATWGHIVVAAFFCNALPFALFSLGQQTVDSGVAGVLNATTPLWAALIGVVAGTERGLRPVRLLGLLLGFAGVVLIFAPWRSTGPVGGGALAIVAAAASYAVGFAYMGRHLVGKGVPTISLAAAQLVAATALTALLLPAGGLAPVVRVGTQTLIVVVILGVVATGATFYLTYRIIAAEGATNAAAVGYLLPVVSVALGVVVLGEGLNPWIVAGMVVVLGGVGLIRRHQRPPSTPAPAPAATSG
ncbi:DMT family transporter [Polymorphospora sp. NPDC050346]|uniref:DMT family transporter n=1 Tax=Polymorphospora sp. NPDC050346 TaxID=3155780 RepID=UPI003411D7D5